MRFLRRLLVLLVVFFSRTAEAAPAPVPPLDLVDRIEVAEKAWFEAMAAEPQFLSLGAVADLSAADVTLTSVLQERLKLLNRKVLSNRQWREHWVQQQRAAAALESLYGERIAVADPAEHQETADLRSCARDWAALAEANASNQDAFLISFQTEHDAVEERLENALFPATPPGQDTPRRAQITGASPFEERAAHIADVLFRQAFQEERRAVASLELKLIRQQVKAGAVLRPVLGLDVELAQQEDRIAKQQLRSADGGWSRRWASIATAAAVKLKKIEKERDLGEARERSLELDMNLAESQFAYRDRKSAKIEQEREQAEAFSGWLDALVATVRRQAPRVAGLLLLILALGWLALRMVGVATRTVVKAV
ncbi:MAG: hypothetical protein JKY37_34140 [Nannocystaceae bacterium]|nr:hypothetical protein [Nannocystaceae bacterium]